MKNIFGTTDLSTLQLPKEIEKTLITEIDSLRRSVKRESVVSLYYILVDKYGKTMLLPNMCDVPTILHKELIQPIIKALNIEYVMLFCESSGLMDGVKRTEEQWNELMRKYGNLNNHPNRTDLVQAVIYTKTNSYKGSAYVTKKSSKKKTRTFADLGWTISKNTEVHGLLDGFFAD